MKRLFGVLGCCVLVLLMCEGISLAKCNGVKLVGELEDALVEVEKQNPTKGRSLRDSVYEALFEELSKIVEPGDKSEEEICNLYKKYIAKVKK